MTDAEAVRRVLSGDRDVFAVLVARYREEFGRYAAALCGDADAGADAVQQAFIRAFAGLGSCRDPSRFKAWLFRIVQNQCRSVRDGRRRAVPLDEVDLPAAGGAERRLEQRELAGAIDRALDSLTPEQRDAFVLKHVEGRSYEEMSELLGVGPDALKMRVYRARDLLKERLRHLYE